jgi:hypothetical protein
VLVDDRQIAKPETEAGQLSFRQDIISWSYNESGEPQPFAGVTTDCARMNLFNFALSAAAMTKAERRESLLPEHLKSENLKKKLGTAEFVEDYWARDHALSQQKQQEAKEEKEQAAEWRSVKGAPVGHRKYRRSNRH